MDEVVNLACSGAETRHVLNDAFKDQGKSQVELMADEIERQGNKKLKAVVVSIGGNDLDLSTLLTNCGKDWVLGDLGVLTDCTSYKNLEEWVKGKLGNEHGLVKEGVGSLNEEIHNVITKVKVELRKHPNSKNARIIIQSYPNPFPSTLQGADGQTDIRVKNNYARYFGCGVPANDETIQFFRDTNVRIRDAIRLAAQKERISFLDLLDTFNGHEVCSRHDKATPSGADDNGAQVEWVRGVDNAIKDGIANNLIGQRVYANLIQEAAHPNYYGQLALQSCLKDLMLNAVDEEKDGEMLPRPIAGMCRAGTGKAPNEAKVFPNFYQDWPEKIEEPPL
ncbi:GDSL-like Lipase/Acylhydrolase family [Streptomyces noursei ATCC 11455]|nr:GDSL-like Lipase/Acylhydrolase family [Streptomyces noursei ATCC 11455]